MKALFAYIRVSTPRQGEQGVSLNHQRDAISRYAEHHGLQIAEWFEERQTAAKSNRPIFLRMMKLLAAGRASGVVIHKIDRSTRNLKDWADLGELIDQGVEVHFAHETLDLHSRGGRLSADIQAVVAADYIRNLRQETIKGFYGRLKQGLYPRPAPMGYDDSGPGRPKVPNPQQAPLIRLAFELYATGRFTLKTLGPELQRHGLVSAGGGALRFTTCAKVLHNPFYMGVIRICRTGQTFPGVHVPIVSPALFSQVQRVLTGRVARRGVRSNFVFRRLVRCAHCGYSLIGERQKGHIYYRCHSANCPMRGIREERLDDAVRGLLEPLVFNQGELEVFGQEVAGLLADEAERRQHRQKADLLQLASVDGRLQRVTDLYVDRGIELDEFERRKTALLVERRALQTLSDRETTADRPLDGSVTTFLELAADAYSLYEQATTSEKRDLLEIVSSNLSVDRETPMFTLAPAFQMVADRAKCLRGSPSRSRHRTKRWLLKLSRLLTASNFRWPLKANGARGKKLIARGWYKPKDTSEGEDGSLPMVA